MCWGRRGRGRRAGGRPCSDTLTGVAHHGRTQSEKQRHTLEGVVVHGCTHVVREGAQADARLVGDTSDGGAAPRWDLRWGLGCGSDRKLGCRHPGVACK